jgi:site-specific recombinase XerD
VDIIYLTESELLNLYYLEGLAKTQEYVRDNFCFGCFTGLRFSDISRISKENIKGDFLEIVTQKTKDFIKIPLNDFAKQIIEKYSGGLPRSISNQKTNDILKEIGEIAELNEVVVKRKFKGVKVIEVCEPKHKLLSTHAARRTFVTLSLEKGMRPETVMSITGHKDYATFKKYIKLTDNVRLLEMNKIWNSGIKIA